MTERILGEAGPKRRRRFRFAFLPVLLGAALTLFMAGGALAVHDTGAFQLDGNASTAAQSNPPAAEDWDVICNAHPLTCTKNPLYSFAGLPATAATRSAFITDGFISSSDNIYKGGTDDADVNTWLWKQAAPSPDKDDIEHAFAAEYTISAAGPYQDHKVLFFGGDRLSNNGSTNIGLWFFQNPVGTGGTNTGVDANGNPTCSVNSGCGFTGTHKVGNKSLGGTVAGDLFILSAFANGGAQPQIKVFEWVGPGNATKNYLGSNGCFTSACTLQPLAIPPTPGFTDNRCNGPTVTGDVACAIVNPGGETTPWTFTDKTSGAAANTYGSSELYEGGLDLTGLGFGEACFSTVLLNSRSSTSGTSALQDFATGSFGSCGSEIATTPQAGDGTAIPSTIGASARVAVRDHAVITVTGSSASFNGTVKFYLCGPLALTTTSNCSTGGVQIGTPATGETVTGSGGTASLDSDSATLTSAGRYCWRAEYSGDAAVGITGSKDPSNTTNTSECFSIGPEQPTLTTQASGTVALGNSITDTASLTGTAKQPGTDGVGPGGTINATAGTQAAAGGSITFSVKGPNNCNASGLAVTGSPVTVSGDNTSYGPVSATPTAVGTYTFVASYSGNSPNTLGVNPSACPDTTGTETSRVVNANIQITPATATNGVNTNHVLTITVNASSNGTLDAGTFPATASIVSGPGSFVGSPTCNYTVPVGGAASASCTVTITSTVAGTTVVSATSNIHVSGQTISRTTGTQLNTDGGGSGNASKIFVNANIQITPATATNGVNTNHVLTITVNASSNGTLDAGTFPATASIVSGPGSFVGSPTCNYTVPVGGAASASCTVTITSTVAGTTVVSATSNIHVSGQTISRTTGTQLNTDGGGSGNASKIFVNANIQITPATATNGVNTNHVLTITVNASSNGTLDAGTFPATASIVSGPGSFVGSPTCNYTAAAGATTATCTVTITSTTAGTTVVSATSNIHVSGQTISRTTGTQLNTDGGGSGNASKIFVNANIQITPATATNGVNTNHVLTITVSASSNGTLDAGTFPATASIVSGPGSFVGSPTCNYTAAAGATTATCTVTITSTTPGTTVVSATSNIHVSGQTISRTTGTQLNTDGGGSGNASKIFVNANIQITPATATNGVNTNHVLTITVNASSNGTLDAGTFPATASIVSGPGSFVGSPTCNYTAAAGATTATCTVTITSTVAGTTVVSATSNIHVSGQTISRTTGTQLNTDGGGSGNASKIFVNANIQITPATATNPVGTNHVLTITVSASSNGTLDAGTFPATASIVSGPGSFVGSPTCNYTAAAGATTATCTVTITSTTPGTTVVSATSSIHVSGQTISRTTGTQVNTDAGGSGNASKLWVGVGIVTGQKIVISDFARVTGFSTVGAPLTGTVTFQLFKSSDCATGTKIYDSLAQPIDASGVAHTLPSNDLILKLNGTYSWLVSYSGDANNLPFTSSCGIEKTTISGNTIPGIVP